MHVLLEQRLKFPHLIVLITHNNNYVCYREEKEKKKEKEKDKNKDKKKEKGKEKWKKKRKRM